MLKLFGNLQAPLQKEISFSRKVTEIYYILKANTKADTHCKKLIKILKLILKLIQKILIANQKDLGFHILVT